MLDITNSSQKRSSVSGGSTTFALPVFDRYNGFYFKHGKCDKKFAFITKKFKIR